MVFTDKHLVFEDETSFRLQECIISEVASYLRLIVGFNPHGNQRRKWENCTELCSQISVLHRFSFFLFSLSLQSEKQKLCTFAEHVLSYTYIRTFAFLFMDTVVLSIVVSSSA